MLFKGQVLTEYLLVSIVLISILFMASATLTDEQGNPISLVDFFLNTIANAYENFSYVISLPL
jgi:hypothetical protein